MKAFLTLIKIEGKITIRNMDTLIFGILFPIGMAIVLGIIYGNKPAYQGADYTFLEQSFGAIISIGICATGLMGVPLTIADLRHRKILKRFKVTPISPGMLLNAHMVIQFVIAVISFLSVYLVMKLFFGYSMRGNLLWFLLSYLLVMVSIYGLGMMLASISPNMKTANLLCSLLYFPMIFLSGATVPYEAMPKGMQRVTDFLPLTQGIKLLKGFSLGLEPEYLFLSIIVMVSIAVISIVISIKTFRWE